MSPDPDQVTAAILAGGAASRLGGLDKGLHPLRGRPLVEWVVEALRRESDGPLLIVANRNLSRYARFAATVPDTVPGHAGPVAGVCAALSASLTPWVFTVPVDCVRPPAGLLQTLVAASRKNCAKAVVAHDRRRRQPLFALYPKDLLASCSAGLDQAMGVSRWQDSIGIIEVVLDNPEEDWINLNSAEEFAACEESLDG